MTNGVISHYFVVDNSDNSIIPQHGKYTRCQESRFRRFFFRINPDTHEDRVRFNSVDWVFHYSLSTAQRIVPVASITRPVTPGFAVGAGVGVSIGTGVPVGVTVGIAIRAKR